MERGIADVLGSDPSVCVADAVATAASGGHSSTTAFSGSTEAAQFHDTPAAPHVHQGDDEVPVHDHEWAVAAK